MLLVVVIVSALNNSCFIARITSTSEWTSMYVKCAGAITLVCCAVKEAADTRDFLRFFLFVEIVQDCFVVNTLVMFN